MRTLVIYYSYSGNNRLLAEELARRSGDDLCAVTEAKRRTWLTMLADVMFAREPAILPLPYDPAAFDLQIMVAPVWGAQMAHPMKAAVRQARPALTRYAFITLCGYARPHQQANLEDELTALAGHAPEAVVQLPLCELFPEEQRNRAAIVSSYRATPSDLDMFSTRIDAFLQRIRPSGMPVGTPPWRRVQPVQSHPIP